MAFDKTQLALLASANGFQEWVYDTQDAHAAVDTAGYFNGAANSLRVGDIINVRVFADVTTKAAITTFGRHLVNQNSGGVVDVADVTAQSVTDTD